MGLFFEKGDVPCLHRGRNLEWTVFYTRLFGKNLLIFPNNEFVILTPAQARQVKNSAKSHIGSCAPSHTVYSWGENETQPSSQAFSKIIVETMSPVRQIPNMPEFAIEYKLCTFKRHIVSFCFLGLGEGVL